MCPPPSSSLLHSIHCFKARIGAAALFYVFSAEPDSALFTQIHAVGITHCKHGCVTGTVSCRWRGELNGTCDPPQDPVCLGMQADGPPGGRRQRHRHRRLAVQDHIPPEQ